MDVSAFVVFLAGLLSFLSPCVLPLVPGYVSMLSGIGVDQLKEGEGSTGKLLLSAIAFVVGFSVVFITFGASASAVGSFLLKNRNLLAPIAGALIVLFGLHLVGWLVKISVNVGLIVGALLVAIGLVLNFRAGETMVVKPVHFYAASLIFLLGPSLTRWLNRDVHLRNVGGGSQPGMVSGFLLGFAFAFGWTPCIGPILGGVLLIASTKNTVGQGIFLLSCYSAGLAIPFLLFAVGIGRFMKFYKSFRRYVHWVEVGSGVLLLVFGGLVFVNELTMVSSKLAFFQPENLIVIAKGKSPSNVSTGSSQQSAASSAALAAEPDVTFKDLQGNNVALSSLKGKLVLVNFWGTWCEPCRGEIPILISMQQQFASKGFTVLGVATNDDVTSVDPFIHHTQFNVDGHQTTMNYPIVMGSDDISTKFGGLIGMPTSFLISRDGKIIKRYIGAFANGDEINKEVESHL